MTEREYHAFYLKEAQMLVKAAEIQKDASDEDMLNTIQGIWGAAKAKPSDEYICIVDKDSRLILHTANPGSVDNYAGENQILGNKENPTCKLSDLVKSQKNYVGDYISSTGYKQVAAFAAAPEKGWMVGLHRSKAALMKDVESGMRFSKYGFLIICGLLMPLSLLLIYATFHVAEKKRKLAEKEIRDGEERFRALFEQAAEAIFVHDLKGHIKDVNHIACQRLGYEKNELLNLKVKDIDVDFFERDDWVRFLAEPKQNAPIVFESRHLRKDGSVFPVEVSLGPIHFIGQRLMLAVARDISDRKQAEEERAKLEAQVQEAQKMQAIGTLAGGIAHDFNNILSSVIGFTELALEDAKQGTLQQENLKEVLKAGNRAKDLVRQILTFSRQADQEQKPVQVKTIVKEALKLLRASIPTTIEIKQNVQSNALVIGDSTQIHQILMNLCTNASHAMQDKGGILTVNLFDAQLDSEFVSKHPDLKPGSYINLTVTDSGHGIPASTIEKIFNPFFTTKEKGKGTGMGLPVVHGIVHSHGGVIYAHSEPGKGSTFNVFLPALEKRLKPEDKFEKPIPTGTERILFIDDEPSIVNTSKQILESLGYDVVTCVSSIEALRLFKAQKDRFDLVITDMTMPQMTGENLAGELIRIKPDIPVILCTGFSASMDEKKAMDMGIRAFVSKPILKRELSEIIRNVLDREKQ
jgi:two-component system cell cycle sensor histidine kinase/response regulator CckA